MNIAVILAGGTGSRVGSNIPKQFIKIMGKPVLAYTLERFEKNKNIDIIEIVCHKDWILEVKRIIEHYNINKVKWIVKGGTTFQESVLNGIFYLKDKINYEDLVVISFGVAPLTTDEIIDDSIRVCNENGSNAIASEDIILCTCIKDNDYYSSQSILRETLKGFSNPWTFKYGELYETYKFALEKDILKHIEPHTTSLYFAVGKKIYFSKSSSKNIKITTKEDLDIFKGILLVEKQK